MSTAPPHQVCTSCQSNLPQTAQYFDRDNSKQSGLRDVCKQCRSVARRQADDTERVAVLQKFDEALLQTIDTIARTGSPVPHRLELYQALTEAFGGPGGVAQQVAATYIAAKPGSSVRQKILAMYMTLSENVSAAGDAAPPLDLMDTDEIERLHLETARRIVLGPEDVTAVEEPSNGTAA